MGQLRVTDLYTYPVKSCAGVALDQAALTATGVELDREFMLVDEDLDLLTQRKLPEMALIHAALTPGAVKLSAPGMPDAEIPLAFERDDGRLLNVSVHGEPVVGQHVSDELDEWFMAFLPAYKHHRRYRLVRIRADRPRFISETYRSQDAANRVAFADASAILLASRRSLAELNTHLDKAVPMDRFRPNIVVDGDDLAPYDEDFWTEVRIGTVQAYVTNGCDRCEIPDVDQRTAETGKAVRRALVSRRGVNAHDETNTGVFFAQNLNHVFTPGARVRVGDVVEVVSRAKLPNVRMRPPGSARAAAIPA